jgi:hypothetical protein
LGISKSILKEWISIKEQQTYFAGYLEGDKTWLDSKGAFIHILF